MRPTSRRALAASFFLLAAACGSPRLSAPAATVVPAPGLSPIPHATPVELHGELSVEGGQLVDKFGAPVQLRGVSSHGMQWFPQFMNKTAFTFMRDHWNLSIVRLAMYDEEGGYLQDPTVEDKVTAAVDAAVAAGIYVVIDWHILSEGDPNHHTDAAKAFFQKMAQRYGATANVLYEICNEPNGSEANWPDIKRYADQVIPSVRADAPHSVIIVGTPQWSQRPDAALQAPLSYPNIMYTMHFYSGSHKQEIRDNLTRARNGGLAVIVTEWSTSQASGDGGPYEEEGDLWMSFLKENNTSWMSWSLSNKNESSALLAPAASSTGPWTDEDLSVTGRYVKAKMLQ